MSLPSDIFSIIGNADISFRDVCNLSAASHLMHDLLGPVCQQNKQLRERYIQVYSHDRHPNWPWQIFHVSDFSEAFSDEYRIFQWKPVGVHIYIDIADKDALFRLCEYVREKYPNPKTVEIYTGRWGQKPCDHAESNLTDSMLATIASRAEHVSLCRCMSITDTGIKSLHKCKDLFILDCPLVNMSKSLGELMTKHSLLSIDENGWAFDEPTKVWLHMLHRHGIVRVYYQPKASLPDGHVPAHVRTIMKAFDRNARQSE